MSEPNFFESHAQADFLHCTSRGAAGLTIDLIASHALQKGQEISRTSRAVVYEDHAPGLRFLVEYRMDSTSDQLHFSTAVYYESIVGRVYFFFVKPIHYLVAPLVPRITVRRAHAERAAIAS